MTGPWDGFGSPVDDGISHLADLFMDYTPCGLPRTEVTWTSVTTRTTCPLCMLANDEAIRRDEQERRNGCPNSCGCGIGCERSL